MVHAALLLLMLEAANADLVFTISLKRSTLILLLSTNSPADYPIYRGRSRHRGVGEIGLWSLATICDVGVRRLAYWNWWCGGLSPAGPQPAGPVPSAHQPAEASRQSLQLYAS